VLASLLALAALMAPAQAQLARSFVSAEIGNDANAPNCSRLAPCRTFQAAHDNTLDKGEVTVLDPGSYGAVTIRKNISIINDGVGEAGILVSGNHIGVFVDAPSASVTLRGLTIKGIGFGGGIGIQFSVGSALNVENCTVRNLDGQFGAGINFEPAASPVPMGVTNSLQVTNSIISDNTSNGIFIASPGGTSNVVAVLDHVGLYNNSIGLLVSGFGASGSVVMATVVESVASSNANSAFAAESVNGAGFARILLVRSAVSGNHPGNGILSNGGNAKILVNESAVYGNANGWQAINGGQLFSFGNNAIAHNGANEGPQSPLALK
jgi:hypothetical protein